MPTELDGELVKLELDDTDNPMEMKARLHTFELPLDFLREITNDFSTERVISKHTFATVFKVILLPPIMSHSFSFIYC